MGPLQRLAAVAVVLAVLAIAGVDGCDKGACQDYGAEPKFDASDRPPSSGVLGRATWTMLHTTAAYLPEKLQPEEAAGFKDLVSSVVNLYPGDGGRLIQTIFDDPVFRDEFDMTDTAEHAQLVVWKLHNAVNAEVWPHKWPFPQFMALSVDLFDLAEGLGKKQMYLANMPPFLRKIVLKELKKRWVLDEGLVEAPLATRDAHNLPPDRTMLGRAFWTYIHTVTMYLRHRPSGRQLASFRAIFSAIYHVYPCPVCRGHFRKMYPDATVQQELSDVTTKHAAILFAWKIHNIVTVRGIRTGQWPEKHVFPQEKHLHFNLSQFFVPPPEDMDQLHITVPCRGKHAKSTDICLSKRDGFEVIADVQGRWQIEGGIDQPLSDEPSIQSCDPPRLGQRLLIVEMYVMGKCPWCAKSMEKLADNVTCDWQCRRPDGRLLQARLDFQLHMVGLNNGTYRHPWLRAIHGSSELVGERLEMCAREHYSKDYQYLRFFKCMDRNVTTIPLRAPDCAIEADMDLDLLVACANLDGERLVAQSYGYSSWMGIDITPTFVINSKRKMVGLPDNFSDIMCEELDSTPWSLLRADKEYGVNAMGMSTDTTLKETAIFSAIAFGALCLLASPFMIALYRVQVKARRIGERRALLRK